MTIRQLDMDNSGSVLAIRPARVRRVTTVEAVVEELKEGILSGRLPAGTILPAEAELCRLLGVSRTTIREAAQVLEQQGLVARGINPGRRLIVLFAGGRATRVPLTDLLEYGLVSFSEVIEMLQLMEPCVASLAAVRATRAEREAFRETMDQLVHTTDLETARNLHFQLHDQVSAASHNRLLALTIQSIEIALRPTREQLISDAASLATVIEAHTPLTDAIVASDPAAADAAARNHVRTFDRVYQAYRSAHGMQDRDSGGSTTKST